MVKSRRKDPCLTGNMIYDKMMGPQFELAKAYVPIQVYNQQYTPEVGLMRGTIFPELYRPYPPCPMRND